MYYTVSHLDFDKSAQICENQFTAAVKLCCNLQFLLILKPLH